MSTKYIYLFSEGDGSMRELLGGKGANLAEMNNLGMPVPQGFTITTEACTRYYQDDKAIAPEILSDLLNYMTKLETTTGKRFGSKHNPLLVSVRSGARVIARVPVIPGFNRDTETLRSIFALAARHGIRRVDLLPYHTLGVGKYAQLGLAYPYPDRTPLRREDLAPDRALGASMGLTVH